MKKEEIKLYDEVYRIVELGSDTQIVKYTVGWIGEKSFIPVEFQQNSEEFQIIDYSICYKSPEEAKEKLESIYGKIYGKVKLIERYNGWYYDVEWVSE